MILKRSSVDGVSIDDFRNINFVSSSRGHNRNELFVSSWPYCQAEFNLSKRTYIRDVDLFYGQSLIQSVLCYRVVILWGAWGGWGGGGLFIARNAQ